MKINDKNLAAFASSTAQIDREGQLMKKGDGGKGFVRRWFVLKGNLLFYFDKKSDREPLGVIILEGSTVELAESESEEHFCFKISFPSKSYVLSAEDQQGFEGWMKSLACASYDYVKLMAAELERKLDDLCKSEIEQPSTSNSNDNAEIGNIPTPPPIARIAKPQAVGTRKSFGTLLQEFGQRIIRLVGRVREGQRQGQFFRCIIRITQDFINF